MKHIKIFLIFFLLLMGLSTTSAQVTIKMEKIGNVYSLLGKINGLTLNFIFDTGASDVFLSLSEALFMLKNGYLSPEDIKDTSYSQIANGDIVENTNVVLKEVEIGGIKIYNVTASISHSLDAPLLLGQSAIQKLGPIQLDGNNLIIKNGKDFKSEKEAWDCYYRGFQEIEAENYDMALETLNKALELTSDKTLKSKIYEELAAAYYNLGQNEMAIQCCHSGLAEDFMNEQLGYNLGVYLYEMGEMNKSEKAFAQLINKFENVSSADKEILSSTFSYLGDIQYRKGEFVNAENSYKKSIAKDENSAAYFGLADVYYSQNQYSQAVIYYEKGIKYEPNRPSNIKRYHQLGMSYLKANQYNKARDAFSGCTRTMQKNDAIFQMALNSGNEEAQDIYTELMFYSMDATLWLARLAENFQERIGYYESIISIPIMKNLFEPIDYADLAQSYQLANMVEKAKDLLVEATELFPDDIDIMFRSSFLEDNDMEKIEILQKILKYEDSVQPRTFDYATVYNNIAWSYCCLGQYAKGLPYAEKSVKLKANYGHAWETLGELYFYTNKYLECIDAMTHCLSSPETDQYKSAYTFRGKALIKIGKKKEGKKDLEAANSL